MTSEWRIQTSKLKSHYYPHSNTHARTHTYMGPFLPLASASATFNMNNQSHPPFTSKTQGPPNALADTLAEFPLTISEPNISKGKKSLKRSQLIQRCCSLP